MSRETSLPAQVKAEGEEYPMTLRIPRETVRTLRHMAVDRGRTLQGLVAGILDAHLQSQGAGPFYPPGHFEARQGGRRAASK